MTSGAEVDAEDAADQAELWLHIVTRDRGKSWRSTAGHHGCRDWTGQETFSQVPEDAELIRFGLTLSGAGRVRLRNADLIRAT